MIHPNIDKSIKELPNLETIRKELSNSTSPLVTKNEFSSLENKVSNIEGAVNSHFRNNLIALLFSLATIVLTQLSFYNIFISKIDSMRTTITPTSSPASANTATPSPSKPTP